MSPHGPPWIPPGFHVESAGVLAGLPGKKSPHGLHTPRGVHMESRRNLWGRVKSSLFIFLMSPTKFFKTLGRERGFFHKITCLYLL